MVILNWRIVCALTSVKAIISPLIPPFHSLWGLLLAFSLLVLSDNSIWMRERNFAFQVGALRSNRFEKAFIKNSLWAVFLICPLSNMKALSAARSVMLCTLLHASRRWIILADAIFSAACNEPIIQRERSLHSAMATSHGPAWQVICLTKVIQEGHPPLGP